MGRGRARAKQQKVARDLKYRSVDTDFVLLERELRGDDYRSDEERESIPDAYADLAEEYAAHEADESEEYGSTGSYIDDDEDARGA